MKLRSLDAAAFLHLHLEALGKDESACDIEKLTAALAYPLGLALSGGADVAAIAAAYAVGILRHRPFFAANEQAAFLALGTFLYLNTWRLEASPEEATQAMRMLASAELDEDSLSDWIRQRL